MAEVKPDSAFPIENSPASLVFASSPPMSGPISGPIAGMTSAGPAYAASGETARREAAGAFRVLAQPSQKRLVKKDDPVNPQEFIQALAQDEAAYEMLWLEDAKPGADIKANRRHRQQVVAVWHSDLHALALRDPALAIETARCAARRTGTRHELRQSALGALPLLAEVAGARGKIAQALDALVTVIESVQPQGAIAMRAFKGILNFAESGVRSEPARVLEALRIAILRMDGLPSEALTASARGDAPMAGPMLSPQEKALLIWTRLFDAIALDHPALAEEAAVSLAKTAPAGSRIAQMAIARAFALNGRNAAQDEVRALQLRREAARAARFMPPAAGHSSDGITAGG